MTRRDPSSLFVSNALVALPLVLAGILGVSLRGTPVHAATVAVQAVPAQDTDHGAAVFQQYCTFCHGKDAAGGDTGPDLTRSRLVTSDVNGNNISPVIHNGRSDKGMPRFALNDSDTTAVVAFLHNQAKLAQDGHRRGVEDADLKTGDAAKGAAYFTGPGGCATCHSTTGDLQHIASRYSGLELERQMLYPKNGDTTATVKLRNGSVVQGKVIAEDEFHLSLRDSAGAYHSFDKGHVQAETHSARTAHINLLPKYSDDDIHNLLAYLQELR